MWIIKILTYILYVIREDFSVVKLMLRAQNLSSDPGEEGKKVAHPAVWSSCDGCPTGCVHH